MDFQQIFPIVLLLSVAALVFLFIFSHIQSKSKKKRIVKRRPGEKRTLIPSSVWTRIYSWTDKFFLSKQEIRRISRRVQEMSIYSLIESRVVVARLYVTSTLALVGIIIGAVFMFKEIFMIAMFFLFGTVMKNTLINKQLDKLYFQMHIQLDDSLMSLSQAYMRTGSVVEALQEIEVGALLTKQFAEIATILTSTDAEKKLEEFYASAPIKALQTLAGICFQVDNGGDAVDEYGNSTFIKSLNYIGGEIKMEIQRLMLQKETFGILEYLPVVPLLALEPIRWWMGSTIPGTQVMYNGMYGFISRIVIVLLATACYSIISKINSPVVVKFDDRAKWVTKLMRKKRMQRLVKIMRPHKLDALAKKYKIRQKALSRLSIDQIYCKKIVFCAVAFVGTFIVLAVGTVVGYYFQVTNIQKTSLMQTDPYTPEQASQINQIDEIYMRTPNMSEGELRNLIESTLTGVRVSEVDEQVRRAQDKKKRVENSVFHWWYFFVALGVGFIAYNAPEFQLKFRTWLIQTESEEDCLQLQTIISILMNTSIDTLELLDWLVKHSRVHRHVLVDALHEYASNPYLALNRLKDNSSLNQFKHMCDGLLLTVDKVSIAEAFSNLSSERDHLMRLREISQVSQIKKKRSMMSPVSLATAMTMIGLYFVGPIGVIGISEFTYTFNNLPM